MTRFILITIAALAVGALAGAGALQARLQPELAAKTQQQQQLEAELAQLKAAQEPLLARLNRLETENAERMAKLRAAEEELDALRQAALAEQQEEPATGEVDLMSLFDFGGPLPRSPLEEEFAQVDAADGSDEEEDPEREAQRAEWEARRSEWATQFRDGIYNRFMDAAAASEDAVEQERLTALAEYTDQMFDLRRQMREAQTDEDREQLREQMDATRTAVRQMVRDQQDHMLQDVATQYGLEGRQQRQFTNDLRETLESPFFTMSGRRGGWGGGSGRGSWGGRGGGGGNNGGN